MLIWSDVRMRALSLYPWFGSCFNRNQISHKKYPSGTSILFFILYFLFLFCENAQICTLMCVDASSLSMRPALIHWPACERPQKSNQSIADMLLYVQCSWQTIRSQTEKNRVPLTVIPTFTSDPTQSPHWHPKGQLYVPLCSRKFIANKRNAIYLHRRKRFTVTPNKR